jgi:thioester reductase-like protein
VDFNHTLSPFTSQVHGVQNLATFNNISPRQPHLFFISSISTVGNWSTTHPDNPPVPETIPDNDAVSTSMGCGESNHVSERILDEMTKRSSGKGRFNVLRVGQIARPAEGK